MGESSSEAERKGSGMKSVVVLLLDALRYDYVTPEITPNLTAFSEEGEFYTSCYTGNSCTVKSMPVLLCGEDKFRPEKSIMARLRRKGYQSVLIYSSPLVGKQFTKGWDYVIDIYRRPGRVPKRRMKRLRKFLPNFAFGLIRRLYRWYQAPDKYIPYERAEKMLMSARNVISMFGDKPTFVWVHLMDPHIPYYPTNTDMSHSELVRINDKVRDAIFESYSPTEEEVKLFKELYRMEVSEMDKAVGDFYRSMNWDDRLLVITSDHGEEFGEHGNFSHKCDKFIQELQHVPLIVVGEHKGVTKGSFSHYNFPSLIYEKLGLKSDV